MNELRPRIIESISVQEFWDWSKKPLDLELVAGEGGMGRIIGEKSLNRPALALVNYFRYFAHQRIQVFGAGEMAYLRDAAPKDAEQALRSMAERKIPCMIVTRNLAPTKPMVRIANEYKIPLIRSPLKSKSFSTEATLLLEEKFAPRVSMHGTLLDIKGIGTVIYGDSGVGKSECALALIERGHSLVADDLIHVRLLRDHELVGTSSDLSRGYMECRGIGIIDVAKMFGVRSVRLEKRIDLIVSFREWNSEMDEQRTGLDGKHANVLGVEVPLMEISVRPGRDMARLVEVGALVEALRGMGYDGASEFNERLIRQMVK